jgi:hypothetical protein
LKNNRKPEENDKEPENDAADRATARQAKALLLTSSTNSLAPCLCLSTNLFAFGCRSRLGGLDFGSARSAEVGILRIVGSAFLAVDHELNLSRCSALTLLKTLGDSVEHSSAILQLFDSQRSRQSASD